MPPWLGVVRADYELDSAGLVLPKYMMGMAQQPNSLLLTAGQLTPDST